MRLRRTLAAGLLAVLAYAAGAALSGASDPWARRPLLDGLAPPTPYRWVKPPPELAAANKPPAQGSFEARLGSQGNQVGAFGTGDGQFNLVLAEGAVPAQPGQTQVALGVVPLDPGRLGPVPAGLLAAGNAYRLTASYRPSGRPVERIGGDSSVGMVYPLLSAPVASPTAHLILWSRTGRTWTRLQGVDAPGAHQVSARLGATGYFLVAIPPGPAGAAGSGGRGRLLAVLAAAAAVLVLAVGAVLLRLRHPPG
jgi:hypothetical protein